MDMALGLHFICPDGRGGHPLTVCQNIKDHLCSIIPRPIRWQGYDTLQMILNILGHRQRVSSSPAPVAGIQPKAGAPSVHQCSALPNTKNTKNTKKHILLLLFRLCLIVQCYEQKINTSKNITKSVVICTSRQFENFVQKELMDKDKDKRPNLSQLMFDHLIYDPT